MLKWADYLISEVNYDHNHHVSNAKRHKQTEEGITLGEIVNRVTISSDIKRGKKYITIYRKFSTFRKGNKINSFRIGDNYYLRTDANKVELDNFGDLPSIQSKHVESDEATPEQLARVKELEQQIAKLESVQSKHVESDEDLSKEIERIEELSSKISKIEKILSKKY